MPYHHPLLPVPRLAPLKWRVRALCLGLCLTAALGFGPAPSAQAAARSAAGAKADEMRGSHAKPAKRAARIEHSGKRQRGKASYYSRKFAGKKMANGAPMNPADNVAASKTLPLGTKAKVKNLETGKSTVVDIKDRGPYVKDRIIDLSPSSAKKIDLGKDGVAPVEVTPLQVPPPGAESPPARGEGR